MSDGRYMPKYCIGISMLVDVLGNTTADIPAPEFIGPIYNNETDYYFICRIIYTDTVEVTFDVTLIFDGEKLRGVADKTVSSTSSLDVVYTPQDFLGQYGKLVRYPCFV